MTRNMLADETSPYLLQHADNPVHWYPWGPEALARAKIEDKPVLLSVGYAACHWCHVMAHESFEDPATAAVMNRLFVNIKVDREERPDLDAIYQSALALMGEAGGWPLTMFCTPDGKPFWGGTYFPPRAGYGRPGFPDLLEHIDRIYRTEGDKVATNTEGIVRAIDDLARAQPGDIPGPAKLAGLARSLAAEVDSRNGGFGSATKFPHVSALKFLWAYGDGEVREAVLLTLDRMAQGGIYDHLGGGFARYSTDAAWLAPHFEKMLYDNAQFIDIYTTVWRSTRHPLYEARVRETVGWLLREMAHPDGGFYSSLDADTEGVEGRFYVWNSNQINDLLRDGFDLFAHHYDVREEGNWDGHTILNRLRSPGIGDDDTEQRLADMRAILFTARADRVRPGLDDKILTDWNALTIAALVEAAMVFRESAWLEAARRAYAFVRERLWVDEPTGGMTLLHSWRDGSARHMATIDDHAALARAAIALFEATGTGDYLDDASALAARLHANFAGNDGAFYFTDIDAQDVIVRTRTGFDNPTPSGNGLAADVLGRLYLLTGDARHRSGAEAVIRVFAGEHEQHPIGYGTLLLAAGQINGALQVTVVGEPDDPDTQELLDTAWRSAPVQRTISCLAPGAPLHAAHPAGGKINAAKHPVAFVCRGPVCSLPLYDGAALALELS
ncbi:MAG: thioredoxin domain-containing protein [Alphaproteobacteria bacterium]|nr:thioredoxin domain-containing protein [Alphaproteobacteria bacterium]